MNVLWNGFRYTRDRVNKTLKTTYWKCVNARYNCPGRLILINGDTVKKTTSHNHDVVISENKTFEAKQKMKEMARTTNLPTQKIIAECVGDLSSESQSQLPRIRSMYKMISEERRTSIHHPVNPVHLKDLVIPDSYLTTSNSGSLLSWDSKYSTECKRSLLLGTEENLSILATSKHWMIDGTFSVAPSLFQQMLTIHAYLPDGWSIPCCYALLPGKSKDVYRDLFAAVDAHPIGPFTPDSILLDYEQAMH